MTSKSPSTLAFAALLANLVLVGTGCGASDSASEPGTADPTVPARDNAAADAPRAPSVGGTPKPSELTDDLGVFVSVHGQADTEGTHARPLASIQAGIDLGKRLGKRVYVCAGTFHEVITLADSTSLIGGLDCTGGEWRTGAPRTRIESPASPAVVASNTKAPTRIVGFEILAPNATQPSGSSIGLLAAHAASLAIIDTKITSGNALRGDDGTDGVQLTNSPTANGSPSTVAAECLNSSVCAWAFGTGWLRPLPASAGINACVGASGHAAQPGGVGGSGGVWEPVNDVSAFHFHPYKAIEANRSDLGDSNRSGAAGTDGTDGANGAAIGTITSDGYTPTNGLTGTDGSPGPGGAGGQGRSPEPDFDPNTAGIKGVWRGMGGAGGGAGGCPGLAGSAAKGGGASIAALIVESDVTFEGTELRAGRGGDAGRGALGSAPTAGGLPGTNLLYSPMAGKNGGRGGTAGVSGNGSNGPSVGIAHVGRAPTVHATIIIPGAGGTAVPARSRDTLGVTKTIPATPAGVSKDLLGL